VLFPGFGSAEILVEDAYLRSATPNAKSAAAFMLLKNTGEEEDRLVSVTSDIATRVELHTHSEDENGVMRMREIEGGIVLPGGDSHHLKRGGDHVMFMGLSEPQAQGGEVAVTLTFEKAGEVEVLIPVDHEREPAHSH
jgi:copper(I)-binding protein